MQPLAPELNQQLRELCAQAYEHYDGGNYRAALRLFYRAWTLIPKPQAEYEQSGWVLSAIGDAYFKAGQFEQGREALISALHCEQMSANPFVHLRLGQCLYGLAETEAAATHLQVAWQRGGNRLFAHEPPHFLALAQSAAQPTGTP